MSGNSNNTHSFHPHTCQSTITWLPWSMICYLVNTSKRQRKLSSLDSLLISCILSYFCNFYFAPKRGANYCHEHVCMSVCISPRISQKAVVVAWSSSDDSAICYVLLVLWIIIIIITIIIIIIIFKKNNNNNYNLIYIAPKCQRLQRRWRTESAKKN